MCLTIYFSERMCYERVLANHSSCTRLCEIYYLNIYSSTFSSMSMLRNCIAPDVQWNILETIPSPSTFPLDITASLLKIITNCSRNYKKQIYLSVVIKPGFIALPLANPTVNNSVGPTNETVGFINNHCCRPMGGLGLLGLA